MQVTLRLQTLMDAKDWLLAINTLVSTALLFTIALTILRRDLWKQTRMFSVYVLLELFWVPIYGYLGVFGLPSWTLWYAAWADDFLSIFIALGIVQESFNRLFAPYRGIRQFARTTMLWAAVCSLLLAIFLAIFHEAGFPLPVQTAFFIIDRSLRVVLLGLVLTLLALSQFLHLRWSNLQFGIAMGIAFYQLVVVAGDAIGLMFAYAVAPLVQRTETTANTFTILLWAIYTLRRDIVFAPRVNLPSHRLEDWDRVLSQILKRPSPPSPPASGGYTDPFSSSSSSAPETEESDSCSETETKSK